MYKAGNLRVT